MKKHILLFFCFTQCMMLANNGNEWADFLCSKTTEEQQEQFQKKCAKVTYKEINKQTSADDSQEPKDEGAQVANPKNVASCSIIKKFILGGTVGALIAVGGILIHNCTR